MKQEDPIYKTLNVPQFEDNKDQIHIQKFIDDNNTCYVATRNYGTSLSISCVK